MHLISFYCSIMQRLGPWLNCQLHIVYCIGPLRNYNMKIEIWNYLIAMGEPFLFYIT